jgi:hypothetical protein
MQLAKADYKKAETTRGYRAIAKLTTLPNVQPAQTNRADGTMPCVAAAAKFNGVVGINADTVHAATASTMISGASAGLLEDHSCTEATIASVIS